MKKIYIILIIITVTLNMYLIFEWDPYVERNNIAVASYENKESNEEINNHYSVDNNQQYDNEELKVQSLYLNQDYSIESLSDKDIEELDKILNKLSTSDLSRWIELKNNENNNNIIDFFKIIHKRISPDDYKKVKHILGEIIDVDRVEAAF